MAPPTARCGRSAGALVSPGARWQCRPPFFLSLWQPSSASPPGCALTLVAVAIPTKSAMKRIPFPRSGFAVQILTCRSNRSNLATIGSSKIICSDVPANNGPIVQHIRHAPWHRKCHPTLEKYRMPRYGCHQRRLATGNALSDMIPLCARSVGRRCAFPTTIRDDLSLKLHRRWDMDGQGGTFGPSRAPPHPIIECAVPLRTRSARRHPRRQSECIGTIDPPGPRSRQAAERCSSDAISLIDRPLQPFGNDLPQRG